MKKPGSVDEYIATFPMETQHKLIQLRKIVKDNAPDASEKLSYGMPYYSLNGRLLYFAAHEVHIGFYPLASSISHFQKELAKFETSKGTVRFPLTQALPVGLIAKIVKFRVNESLSKAK